MPFELSELLFFNEITEIYLFKKKIKSIIDMQNYILFRYNA